MVGSVDQAESAASVKIKIWKPTRTRSENLNYIPDDFVLPEEPRELLPRHDDPGIRRQRVDEGEADSPPTALLFRDRPPGCLKDLRVTQQVVEVDRNEAEGEVRVGVDNKLQRGEAGAISDLPPPPRPRQEEENRK